MKRLLFCAAALALSCAGLSAAPAPWHWWRGLAGNLVCAQTSPGPGWKPAGGPFRDSHCEKLAIAK
jgi:hypothetical protein